MYRNKEASWWEGIKRLDRENSELTKTASNMTVALGYSGKQNGWLSSIDAAQKIVGSIEKIYKEIKVIIPQDIGLSVKDTTLTRNAGTIICIWFWASPTLKVFLLSSPAGITLGGTTGDNAEPYRDNLISILQKEVNELSDLYLSYQKGIRLLAASIVRAWSKWRATGSPTKPPEIAKLILDDTALYVSEVLREVVIPTPGDKYCKECGKEARLIDSGKMTPVKGYWYLCNSCRMAWPAANLNPSAEA